MNEPKEMALADRIECSGTIEIVDADLIDRNFSQAEKDLIVAALRRPAPTETVRAALEAFVTAYGSQESSTAELDKANAMASAALATAEDADGLLNQLSEQQRELAFAYKGPVTNWDTDVPLGDSLASPTEALRAALEDCVAFIRGDISGTAQRDGILLEAEAALALR